VKFMVMPEFCPGRSQRLSLNSEWPESDPRMIER
jgi:hypothetical protein